MKRWLLRRLWGYIEQQLKDVGTILFNKWGNKPPKSLRKLRSDLIDAARWVLKHGRPPEEYPKD